MRAVATEDRFWQHVQIGEKCWEWQAGKTSDGYGTIGISRTKKAVLAHRLSWQMHFGPIPAGALVLHSCDNPPCVHPGHLFLGTQADNMADMKAKGRRKGIQSTPKNGVWNRPRGERNPAHKLTDLQVRELRFAFAAGSSKRSLAARFGISRPTVTSIVTGETWHDVALHGEKL